MSGSRGRLAQGIALIIVGVAALVIAVLVWIADQHPHPYAASKEPFIALLGVFAIAGGILRLRRKIGN